MACALVVTDYVKSVGTLSAVMLADMLRASGYAVHMQSLVLPESGVSRYWDKRVSRYSGVVESDYRHLFYCPSRPESYGKFLGIYEDLDDVADSTILLSAPVTTAPPQLVDDLEMFDNCAVSPLVLKGYSETTFDRNYVEFAVECMGSELGVRTAAIVSDRLSIVVCLSTKLLRHSRSWYNYDKFLSGLLARNPTLRMTLALTSSVPAASRKAMGKFVHDHQQVHLERLSSLSDYPIVFSQHDVVMDLGDPWSGYNLFSCAQATGAVYFGYDKGEDVPNSCNWSVLPGLTGWNLDSKVYEGVQTMGTLTEKVSKALSLVAAKLPQFRSNVVSQYRERRKASLSKLESLTCVS
jgi:hypothetical protein